MVEPEAKLEALECGGFACGKRKKRSLDEAEVKRAAGFARWLAGWLGKREKVRQAEKRKKKRKKMRRRTQEGV